MVQGVYIGLFFSGQCVVCDLFNVVDHTIEQPLYIDFDLSPERKAIEALLSSNIAENRFCDGQPAGIYLSASFRTHLLGHFP